MKKLILSIIFCTMIISLHAQITDSIIDIRDDQVYKVVKIGQQWWMAENLNVGIIVNNTINHTNNDTIEKYCYNNNQTLCNTYGGLYLWDEMMQFDSIESHQGICPSGWHIPGDQEWKELEMSLGMSQYEADKWEDWRGSDQGTKMKTGGTSGFEALYAGLRYWESPYTFLQLNYCAAFWTSTQGIEDPLKNGINRVIGPDETRVYRSETNKFCGQAVRCVMNASSNIIPPLSESLIANYPFNGNANDESGNENNGTVHGATLTTDRFNNIFESAYYFDGIDDYIELGTLPELAENFGSFSFSFWINSGPDVSQLSRFIGSVNNSSNGMAFGLDFHADGSQFEFGRFGMTLRCNDSKWLTFAVYASEIFDNKWHHIVYNFEDLSNNKASVYIDNKIKNITYVRTEGPAIYGLFDNPWTLGAGNNRGAIESFYKGSIDDFKIFKRALTEVEVDSLYLEGGFINLYTTIKNISCFGEADGSIELIPVYGMNPYRFNWSTGDTTSFLDSLVSGEYSVIISDANDSIIKDTFKIIEPSILSIVVTDSVPISYYGFSDGMLKVFASGGVQPYSYLWNDEQNTSGSTLNNAKGNKYYEVMVNDANGCNMLDSFRLDNSNKLYTKISVTREINCHDSINGEATVSVQYAVDPVSYFWNISEMSSDSVASGLGPEIYYTVIITDAEGHIGVDSIFLNNPSPITLDAIYKDTIACFGDNTGFIDLLAIGGAGNLHYCLSDCDTWQGNGFFNGLYAGNYIISIIDENLCRLNTDTITIIQNDKLPVLDIIGKTEVEEYEQVTYSVNQTPNSKYEWYVIGGNVLSGQSTNAVTIHWEKTQIGEIGVIENNNWGCIGDTSRLSVSIGNDFINLITKEELKIFPNPFDEFTTLNFSIHGGSQYKLYIMDISGKVCRIVDNITTSKYVLEKGDLKQGFYFIELRGPDIFRGKFIIE